MRANLNAIKFASLALAFVCAASSSLATTASDAKTCAATFAESEERAGARAYREKFFERERAPIHGSTKPRPVFEPDWVEFDKAFKRFNASAQTADQIIALINSLTGAARQHYILRFQYRDHAGKLREFRKRGPGVIVDEVNDSGRIRQRIRFAETELKAFWADEIDPLSLRVEKKTLESMSPELRISEFAKMAGYRSLRHALRHGNEVETLFKIISEGRFGNSKIEAIENAGSDLAGSYFSLARNESEYKTPPSAFSIEFDLRILDRKDYYVNRAWVFGKYDADSIRFDETDLLKKFLLEQFSRSGEEIVVWSAVPASWIKRIYLPAEEREELLELLSEARIAPPLNSAWEKTIVAIKKK
ncbi:MAG: hypothetical protein V4692_00875 [Bdellovibrionota bacterium]